MPKHTTPFDVATLRKNFPALHQTVNGATPVFLDGPGGTQVPQTVLDAMTHYLGRANSNIADNPFFAVQETLDIVSKARNHAAALLNAENPSNIVFGANMSSMTAHMSRSIAREWTDGDEIIVTNLDHFSNVSFWRQAAEDKGITCHTVSVIPDTCSLDYDHFKSLISEKTKLIAFTLASNVSGSVTKAEPIIEAAKDVGAITYIDAVHYTPHFLPDVQALDCDFLACSAYKFFGPHLGILYGKEHLLNSLQPYKVEPAPHTPPECWETGTKSFEALAGFIATIEYLASYHDTGSLRERISKFYNQVGIHEKLWADTLLERCEAIPAIKIWGYDKPSALGIRSPTFAMTFETRTPQEVSKHLGAHNIATGAHNFYAKGLTDTLKLTDKGGVFRAGAMHYNTLEELDRLFILLEEFL